MVGCFAEMDVFEKEYIYTVKGNKKKSKIN
jgi:hypothetical protein